MRVSLIHAESPSVALEYIGEGVALEFFEGKITPHYFGSQAEAGAWIIKSAYALLMSGYEVR